MFEKVGMSVRLLAFLCDVQRAVTCTRSFLAERIGESPADMGWESQAACSSLPAALRTMLRHPGYSAVLHCHDHLHGLRCNS